MGSLKRKDAPGGNPPAKSAKSSKEARPAKDAAAKDGKKLDKRDKHADSKSDHRKPAAKEQAPKAAVVSLLKEDEPAFPRGGGSVLTPLEQKHIQMEAKADAIRDDEEFNTAGKPKKKARKQTAGSKGDKKTVKKDEADSVKAESLNFKKLVKGSLVLGRITRIHNLSIEVALPNHLTGHVSIVAVSDQLTARLEKDAAGEKDDEEDQADDDESQDQNDIDLKSMFRVGQYLRVYVVSTMDTDATGKGKGKGKRKIELSLRPGDANAGLAKSDIVSNITVMASVVSVEDRGCVMDLGIPGLRGFLSNDEVDPLDQERLQTGAVFLCQVTKATSSTAQLSLKQERLGNVKAMPVDATTVNTFLPGTLVSVLVSNTDRRGLVGKILGHLDATADVVHSGVGPDGTDLGSTYKVGSKIKARVICNFPAGKTPKVGVSLLPHVLSLASKTQQVKAGGVKKIPTEILPISSIVEKCTVRHVESGIGLYVDTDVAGLRGFVHISRVKDGKVDSLFETTGPYKVGSEHRGRILDYSDLDGVFYVSFEKSILEQPYIRLEDVPVGAVVSGQIEKLVITEEGVVGLVVKLADGISGFVPQRHLSDIRLQNPEKKFKEGMKVKARVLSLDTAKKQMRLTLKKTLVNSEAPIVQSYEEASVGMQVLGSLIKLQDNGAHIQFYGSLRGFLPISEMSEAYIRDPSEHFRLGQVVSVHILEVDPEARRLIVSCKDPSAFGLEKQAALKSLQVGDVVAAKVTQKTEDEVFLELEGSQLKAILPVGHLTDKSDSKNQHALKRIAAGQTLSDLVVLEKNEKRRSIILSQKGSLVKAARAKTLLTCFEDAKEGAVVPGFVRNITLTAVFVQFAGGLNALLPRSRLSAETQSKPDFGMRKYESIEVRVLSVIHDLQRLVVVPVSEDSDSNEAATSKKTASTTDKAAAPADDLALGSVTKARITSVKDTQLNVQIIKSEIQGRVDVSQLFDEWDEIADRKKPLAKFHKKQLLNVKVIGVHDAKDHKFLPFSHRSAHSVLELTAKPSDLADENQGQDPKTLSLDSLQVGDTHLAFVNNVSASFLWVNLSPNVRGRISAIEASDDLSQLNDLEANFPVGSALKVRVLAVDSENNRLDLSARSSSGAAEAITWSSLKKNMVLPGRVTKINERQVLVKFSESVSGPIHLPDFADDFDEVNTAKYKKNEILRVSVVEIDGSNKRLRLSLRPSRIMSSTLQVADKEIQSASQLSAGDIVRGFVKNVSDKGLFVLLGGQVTALVKISNLSDRYLKEWKDEFQVDQLVKGRVLSVDAATGQIELSLKASQVDSNYKPPLTFGDIQPGQIVTGQVRKVEDFGAFIVIDDSANVSGLCHRTQMADHPVRDATKLFKEGDKVKAMVLDVDAAKKRISFGLKASLFDEEDTDMDSGSDAGALLEDGEDDAMEDNDHSDSEIEILGTDNVENSDEEEEGDDDEEEGDDDEEDEDDEDTEMADITNKVSGGLGLGKKAAWSADPFDESGPESDTEPQAQEGDKKKKPRKKAAEAQVDRTAELDAHGPQTASDYERLLLGQPDSSELWIAYMAFQMQVSELPKAREVAERAIRSISIKAETEKLNVWIAYLNLEVAYGNKTTIEDVFKRACSYNDEQEVYERLGSIYIQSAKHKEAEQLFESMLKKFGAKAPSVWTNYAHFLHVTVSKPTQARSLLARATQQLDKYNAQKIVSRFAALEFRSPNGEPERGRTMFEGLLAAWPKKGDLWNQLLDLEVGLAGAAADAAAVRDVFERRTRVKGLKPQQAEKWFRRWAAWEEGMDGAGGDGKGRERVMAKAQDWAAGFKARKADAEKEKEDEMEE